MPEKTEINKSRRGGKVFPVGCLRIGTPFAYTRPEIFSDEEIMEFGEKAESKRMQDEQRKKV